jgi:hypothetical protein
MNPSPDRRLLQRSDLPALLQLTLEQIDWLVSTRQITPLRICGQLRFDSRDVNELIETYKQTSTRKIQ